MSPAKKSDSHKLAVIARAIRGHHRFLVLSHVRPDGDAIGAELAMGLMLKKLGKRVTIWNDDGLPQRYAFLRGSKFLERTPSESKIQNLKSKILKFDLILALDTANYERLGKRTTEALRHSGTQALLINIDHHESNERYGDLVWVEPRAAATSQMLFEIFRTHKFPITPNIAAALFVGIQTDTGSFHYSNTSPAVFRAAADLIERGVNVGELGRLVYDTQPAARLRLLQLVLKNLKVTADGRIAYFWLTKKMYLQSGAQPEDTEDLINYARAVDTAIVAFLLEEIGDGRVRISLRSKSPKMNASHIMAKFGGGGHAGAAGATPAGKPREIERAVLAEVKSAMRKI